MSIFVFHQDYALLHKILYPHKIMENSVEQVYLYALLESVTIGRGWYYWDVPSGSFIRISDMKDVDATA